MKNIVHFFILTLAKFHSPLRACLAAILFILTSCEDVIQIKLDEGSKLYVIDAFVNDLRQTQTIRVISNDTYFSNREAPPVPGANVMLTDLSTNTQYNFTYSGNGNYTYTLNAGDTISKNDHQYKLEVTIDGNTYTSLATQKRAAVIDSIAAYTSEGFGPPAPPTQAVTYNCFLFARDIADNNPDYYWVKTFRNDTLFTAPADLNVCIDGTGGIVKDAPQDTIDFTPPSTFLGFKQYRKNNTCKVEIHSVSRETYFFFIQAYYQINNSGLFATTPENVKTNIVSPADAKIKAIGRFNMASVATTSIIIK